MGTDISTLGSISAMSLFVEDVPQARDFYRAVFDVPLVHEDDVSAVLKFDNLMVNLLQSTEAAGLVEPAPVADRGAGARFQLSIWVEDVDAVCDHLRERGVTVLVGPVDRPWGMRVATFTDPAGHSWEIAQGLEAS
jgi:catechol 2,3-dioxygenase-like lactoylglutathione lyase family enzyme